MDYDVLVRTNIVVPDRMTPPTIDEVRARIEELIKMGELRIGDFDLMGVNSREKTITHMKKLIAEKKVSVSDLT